MNNKFNFSTIIFIIVILSIISNGEFNYSYIAYIIIIGVILSIVRAVKKASKQQEDRPQTQYHQDKKVQCTYCNQTIGIHDDPCPICGNSQQGTIVCDYCGHINKGSNLQCENCNALIK